MAKGSESAPLAASGQRTRQLQTKGLTEAVIFIARASIRPLVRQELKNAGVGTIFNAETQDACAEHLAHHPEALLVLDWEHGPETVNNVLRAAKGAFNIETRAIFLIAGEVSRNFVSTAAEYYVSRIHTGEISRGAIQEHLEAIVDQESAEMGLRVLLTRVADARARDDWETASMLLNEMHTRYPDDKRIICELAENYIHEERWSEAQAIVEQLTVTSNHNPRIAHLKARCLMKRGDFEQAAALLQETRLVNPFHVDRLVDLGKALMNVDRIREALETFDEALRLAPEHKEAAHGRLQCKLIDGEVNEALALMRQMTSPRELASLFNNAAVLSVRHGRFEHGLSLYHTAIGALGAKDNLVSRLFYNLGLAYHKQGRSDESLDCFQKALKIDDRFDKARHNAQIVASRIARSAGEGAANAVNDYAEVMDEEKLSPSEARTSTVRRTA